MLSLVLANIRYLVFVVGLLAGIWFANSYINLRIESAVGVLEDELDAAKLEMEKTAKEYELKLQKIEAEVTIENASEESVRRELFNQQIETLNKTQDSTQAGPNMKSALETLKRMRK